MNDTTLLYKAIRHKMSFVSKGRILFQSSINNAFVGKEPWQISCITASSVLMVIWFWNFVSQDKGVTERCKQCIINLIKRIPVVRRRIEEEQNKILTMFQEEVYKRSEGVPYILSLPEKGWDASVIKKAVQDYVSLGSYRWKEGFVSGAVYYYNEELSNIIADVYRLTSYTNPLHPDVFPGVCKMEAEIIKIVAKLFHGNEDTCGSMTSGGTESILMACKAYRDYGKEVKGISHPEIVLPVSAHAAFDKAGHYFNLRLKHISLDPESMTVNLKEMERAISRNTIMLVGSAPNFPYGTVDNIEMIARLGLKYNIPVHVDCCLGSFVVAFMQKLGYSIRPFDFSVPGVTSISVDTHKYGFAPKGSSIVMYSDRKYFHNQYFAVSSWPGGHYGSHSVSGSRSGAIIASCWATLMYFGENGYAENVNKILSTTKYIEQGLRSIDGIKIFGKPFSTVIAFGSDKFHIYKLGEMLRKKRHWNLNLLQFPFGIHICVTQLHTLDGLADQFIDDVRESVTYILGSEDTDLGGVFAVYGMSATIPDRTLVLDFTKLYLDAYYYTPDETDKTNVSIENSDMEIL